MKLRNLLSNLSAALRISAALCTPARAQAPDPCTVFLCMAGISGSGASGPECSGALTTFFSMQVWNPHFNGPATSKLRQTYLMSCPGAITETNSAIMAAIISRWGQVP